MTASIAAAACLLCAAGCGSLLLLLSRGDRLARAALLQAVAEQAGRRADLLGLVNPPGVPRPRRRSPDVGLVRPDVTPRVMNLL